MDLISFPFFLCERHGNMFPCWGPGSHMCASAHFLYNNPASVCVIIGVYFIKCANRQMDFTNQKKRVCTAPVYVLAFSMLLRVALLRSLHSLFSCLFLCFPFTSPNSEIPFRIFPSCLCRPLFLGCRCPQHGATQSAAAGGWRLPPLGAIIDFSSIYQDTSNVSI